MKISNNIESKFTIIDIDQAFFPDIICIKCYSIRKYYRLLDREGIE